MNLENTATVVKHTGSHYMLSRLPEWNLFPAVLRGRIRLKGSTATNPVAVGDIVVYESDNGLPTLNWLKRNVDRKVHGLKNRYPFYADEVRAFGEKIMKSGMTAENTYLFMHGHTLMDNVVMVLLETVCDKLRRMTINKISSSSKKGTALKNEMANYKNTLRPVRDVLLDNDNYTDCFLFKKLSEDIRSYIVKEVSGESRE